MNSYKNGLFQFILTLHINKNGYYTGDRIGDFIDIPIDKYKRILDRV